VAVTTFDEAEVVLLLQNPLIAAGVLNLRQAAVKLRQVEIEAALLGGARRLATGRIGTLTTGVRSPLGRGQSTGRAIRIQPARLAHAAHSESDGKAEAQHQGLQHGRKLSLANNDRG